MPKQWCDSRRKIAKFFRDVWKHVGCLCDLHCRSQTCSTCIFPPVAAVILICSPCRWQILVKRSGGAEHRSGLAYPEKILQYNGVITIVWRFTFIFSVVKIIPNFHRSTSFITWNLSPTCSHRFFVLGGVRRPLLVVGASVWVRKATICFRLHLLFSFAFSLFPLFGAGSRAFPWPVGFHISNLPENVRFLTTTTENNR